MINRSKMPRQLRSQGGITNAVPRTGYFLGGIKKRLRKLIPNELASIAVKAAPFIAPFNPGIAALARGVGRFDQRGSISDALKQGVGTFAFGAGARALGGASDIMGGGLRGGFTSPLSPERTQSFKGLFEGAEKTSKLPGAADKVKGFGPVEEIRKKIPIIRDLDPILGQQLLVGGVTGAATYIYNKFLADEPPQQEGETIEEYMARRKENVGKKMRTYFDNYFKFDKEYSSMTDEQKDAFVARYNIASGGRVGYQTGGITMANTLQENIRRNLANQTAVAQQFAKAQQQLARQMGTPAQAAAPAQAPQMMTPAPRVAQPEAPKITLPKESGIASMPSGAMPGFGVRPDGSVERIRGTENQTGIVSMPSGAMPGFGVRPDGTTERIQGTEGLTGLGSMAAGMVPTAMRKIPGVGGLAPSENYLRNVAPPPMPGLGGLTPEEFDKLPEKEQMKRIEDAFKTEQDMMKKFGSFAGGRQVDPAIGRSAYENLLDVFKFDFPNIKLTGNETLAELDQKLMDLQGFAKGGRVPTGIMRTNEAGTMERDYREKGGFVPVGIKEKADDVPAMLSKNEFVFTADAVRGAGNGSIEKGAQRMYDTMKRLEKGMA